MEKMNSRIKKLSRYRRHRFAGPALLIVALITMGTTFQVASALPNAGKMESTPKSTLIEEGKRIFNLGCSTCHGLNLEAVQHRAGLDCSSWRPYPYQVTGRSFSP
jgi:ubiquinol-cytochrome c reductase cytochrome c subunit